MTGGPDLSIHEVEEAARLVQEAAHEDAHIIFGAVIDETLQDEVRITVIATGFDDRAALVTPSRPPESSVSTGSEGSVRIEGGWRRRVAAVRAPGGDPLEGDLDTPAFLRRQAD